MTKQFILTEKEYSQMEYCLRQINHSQAVMKQNSDKADCVREHTAFIRQNVDAIFHIIK